MNIKKLSITSVMFSLTIMSSVLTVNATTNIRTTMNNVQQNILQLPDNIVAQQLLVQFKDGQSLESLSANNRLMTSSHHSLSQPANKTQLSVLTFQKDINLKTAYQAYQADPSVEAVSYNYRRYLTLSPNDPSYSGNVNYMWALKDTAPDLSKVAGPKPHPNSNDNVIGNDIKAEKAWEVWATIPAADKAKVVVAVIDSGVDYSHPDLKAAMWDGRGASPATSLHGFDVTDNSNDPYPVLVSHGTHVSGIIAATSNNGIGIPSIASGVKIMAIKVGEDLFGIITDAYIIKAINYAVKNGADIINLSLGGKSPENKILTKAVTDAVNAGVLLVIAAGNSNENNDIAGKDSKQRDVYDWPAYYANLDATKAGVISVAATDQADKKAIFSSYGAKSVNIGAPGVNILSAIIGTEIKPSNIASGKDISPDLSVLDPAQTGGTKSKTTRCSSKPNSCFDKTFFSNVNNKDCSGSNCTWGWVKGTDSLSIVGDASKDSSSKYSDSIDGTITSKILDTTSSKKVILHFTAKWDLKCDSDYVDVEVFDGTKWKLLYKKNLLNANEKVDGICNQDGTSTASVHTLTGRMAAMIKSLSAGKIDSMPLSIDISEYNNSKLQVRFHFVTAKNKKSSNKTTVKGGVVIDNIKIITQATNYASAYDFGSGTSMSSPLVAGIAALIKTANPSFKGPKIKKVLLDGGDNLSALSGITRSGKRANAYNVLSDYNPGSSTNNSKGNKGGGNSCSLNTKAEFDPLMPAMLLISLLYWMRNKIKLSIIKK